MFRMIFELRNQVSDAPFLLNFSKVVVSLFAVFSSFHFLVSFVFADIK